MKTFLKTYWLLIAIVIIALILRTYQLDQVPTGLHGDEASVGYNAYSLLKTAHDQNGKFLPLAIDQFGDFRPAGIHYVDILSVGLLGLSIFSTRLPAAIFGAATVILLYILLLQIFGKKPIAFIGAFLLAVSPWHVNISRATSEGVIAAFFVILGTILLLHSFQKKQKHWLFLVLAFASYFVSFLFYHSARLFAPMILLVLLPVGYYQYQLSKKFFIIAIGLFAVLIAGLLFLLTVGKGSYRASDVSLLNIPGGTKELQQALDEEGNNQNTFVTRFLHNKLYFYTRLFAIEYSQHLSGEFLFVNNGLPIRYRIPWTGNVYPVEAPFLLFGFALLLLGALKEKKLLFLIPLAWLFFGPVPAGLTWEDIPNVERASMEIYGLIMLSSVGIYEAAKLPWKKYIKMAVGIFVIFFFVQNFSYFLNNYFYHSRIDAPWYRSASEPDLINQVNFLLPKYDAIYMTTQKNNNFIFYLFYTKFDPTKFQQLGSPREKDGLVFGKIHYTYNPCSLKGDPNTIATSSENALYIDLDSCSLPKNAKVLDTIRTPDGVPTFTIVSLK